MTKEQVFFIRLLRDYVHQEASTAPSQEIDWETILRFANEQDLAGIIYYQSRDISGIPAKIARKIREGFLSNAYISVNMDYAYREIAKLFEKDNIRHMPFKGALVRDYYPHPELRTMGDRDVLIHPEDRAASDEAILSLNYDKFVDHQAVWTYFKKTLMFEIHDVMFYENLANQIDYREYFSHIWETAGSGPDEELSMQRIPDINMHFLYLMAHTAKHVINNGMGFRAFLDMAFFALNATGRGNEPDWDWIGKELESLRLYEFTKVCFTLCEKWFDITMPFHLEEVDQTFLEDMTRKIFRDGVFGLDNEDNDATKASKEIHRSRQGYNLTALGIILYRIFPPYEDLQLVPWYSWIDGKPWLLPVAWVYRWIYCLKNKREQSRDLLLEPYKKKETIQARQQYLEGWKL